MSGNQGKASFGAIQQKIHQDMQARGWSWIWVFDPGRENSPFVYSIGFYTSFNHPEVVVAGLPQDVSENVLSSVHVALTEGVVYSAGDTSDRILEGVGVQFRAIPQDLLLSALAQASAFYAGEAFSALQLVWPDKDGNFPGEGAPAWLNDRQAILP
ncbi:DUF4262 domain-containing protein [Nonomuraea sp. NPDC050540]|uniref:DUF4262 domain-containing protein n=1 Tax=Nonomuraea sp. NPDC050540 TaxID=3364367 RepID=UPI0037A5CAC0